MIDLIIPITSKCPNLKQTLLSILLQSLKEKINITIISTKKIKKQEEIINLFSKKLNINYIVDDTKNINELITYAISLTNNEYIMFVSENTYLYDAFSISNLYKTLINDNTDFVVGNTVNLEYNNYINTYSIYDNTTSKIYKRSYLINNNITYDNEISFVTKTFIYSSIYSYSDSITLVNILPKSMLDKKTLNNIIESIKQLPNTIDKHIIKEYINRIIKNTTDKWLNSNTKYSGILKELEDLSEKYN